GSDLIGKTVLIAALLYSRHFDGLVYAPTRLCRYVSFVSRPQLSKISQVDLAALSNLVFPKDSYFTSIPTYISSDFLPDKNAWSKVRVCDQVYFPSYNVFHDRKNQFPVIRTGIIASFPQVAYSHSSGSDLGHIVAIEAFSHGGSSGAPVFSEKGLIGVIAGHLSDSEYNREVRSIEDVHSGISYIYPAPEIRSLIDNLLFAEQTQVP
ncbi:MAG: hypothetical protein JNM24_03885, partial [Bdellovibrionaceae bacterium]|nr:hypothetical protein [Pseudobdellovibrionaceae bacterium]